MKDFLWIVVLCGCSQAFDWDVETPLDEYVWREYENDPYTYNLHEEIVGVGYTLYNLNMTSQKWMDETVIVEEDTIWRHWVTIIIPNDVTVKDAALMYVSGGNKDADAPGITDGTVERLITFARTTGAVAASVSNVPHSPTTFTDDMEPRQGDQIIARTWRYYIEGIVNNTDVIQPIPMIRAAKRAVDTVIEFTNQVDRTISITKVMASGRSKRGWAAWLLACADPRVFALSPIVLDFLNWNPSLHHHYMAYGGWSFAFQPYWAEEVSKYIDHPKSFYIWDQAAIDPLAYNERLGPLPKMVGTGTGDQFFLLDDSHYYYDQLMGTKFLMIMENTDHGTGGHNNRLWQTMANFFLTSYFPGAIFPDFSWVRTDNPILNAGSLTMTVNRGTVRFVRGWTADTTLFTAEVDGEGNLIHRRDFRMDTIEGSNPIEWVEAEVQQDGNTYTLEFDYPSQGFRGFLMEVSFVGSDPDNEDLDMNFTTEVQIIPDVFPYKKCASEDECRGILK